MRIYAILAGIILILGTGLWYSLSAAHTARLALKDTKVALASAEAHSVQLVRSIVDLQGNVQAVHTKATQVKQGIEHAIKKEPDWGTTPVPTAVVDELCASLSCNKPKTD